MPHELVFALRQAGLSLGVHMYTHVERERERERVKQKRKRVKHREREVAEEEGKSRNDMGREPVRKRTESEWRRKRE